MGGSWWGWSCRRIRAGRHAYRSLRVASGVPRQRAVGCTGVCWGIRRRPRRCSAGAASPAGCARRDPRHIDKRGDCSGPCRRTGPGMDHSSGPDLGGGRSGRSCAVHRRGASLLGPAAAIRNPARSNAQCQLQRNASLPRRNRYLLLRAHGLSSRRSGPLPVDDRLGFPALGGSGNGRVPAGRHHDVSFRAGQGARGQHARLRSSHGWLGDVTPHRPVRMAPCHLDRTARHRSGPRLRLSVRHCGIRHGGSASRHRGGAGVNLPADRQRCWSGDPRCSGRIRRRPRRPYPSTRSPRTARHHLDHDNHPCARSTAAALARPRSPGTAPSEAARWQN